MMWVKLTIIFGIIAICSGLFAKLMAVMLDPDELISMELGHRPPKRLGIPLWTMILSVIATVVCLIVTVVTW